MEELLKQILDGQAQIISRLDGLEESQIGLSQSITDFRKETNQSFADLEDGMGLKISALFDSREEQITANERITTDLNLIRGNIESLTLLTN